MMKSKNLSVPDRHLIKAIGQKNPKPIIKKNLSAISATTNSSDSRGTRCVCTPDAITYMWRLKHEHKNHSEMDHTTILSKGTFSKRFFYDFLLCSNVLYSVFYSVLLLLSRFASHFLCSSVCPALFFLFSCLQSLIRAVVRQAWN